MTAYTITAERENGTTFTANITAATPAQARKDFREVYRHSNCTITNCEVYAENVSATKEQEREALAKIKDIIEQLGPDSYLATAFEGTFEDAETNIENDWACSMKQRADAAEKRLPSWRASSSSRSSTSETSPPPSKRLKRPPPAPSLLSVSSF